MNLKKPEFKKGEWSLLWRFYLSTFIESAFALVPLVFVLYIQFKGFELGLAGYLLAVSGVVGFFFEIPTGAIADVFGRKASTLLHYMSMFFITILIPFATKPYMLYILFALDGIAITFRTGAKQAWIIDNLKYNKRKDLIRSYFTKSQSLLAFASIISGLLLSSLLFIKSAKSQFILFGFNFIGIDLVWFFEAFAYLAVFILLFGVEEHYKPKKARLKQQFKETGKMFKYGIKYSLNHPVIFALLLNALIFTIAGNMRFISFQPYLIENGVQIEQFGYLTSIFLIVGMFLPFVGQRLSKNIRKNVYLALASLVKLFFLVTLYFVTGPILTIACWFVLKNFYYIVGSVEEAYFQEHVTSKGRATIGSIENAMYSMGIFVGPLIAGFMLNYLAPRVVLAVSGLLIIPAIIVYLRIK